MLDFGQNASLPGASSLTGWNPADWQVAPDWRGVVDAFVNSVTGVALGQFIQTRVNQGAEIYPPWPLRALALTPLADVSVVILGQDPYHGPGQAEGLSFSVPAGVKPPPSLRNIQKELQRDLGLPPPLNGSLIRWAQQGVLLLNTCLTVEKEQPASHSKKGWEALTDEVIKSVSESELPVVFMLWGAHALEAAKAGFRYTEQGSSGVLNSLAVYLGGETPFGPSYLGFGYSTSGVYNFFLSVGVK